MIESYESSEVLCATLDGLREFEALVGASNTLYDDIHRRLLYVTTAPRVRELRPRALFPTLVLNLDHEALDALAPDQKECICVARTDYTHDVFISKGGFTMGRFSEEKVHPLGDPGGRGDFCVRRRNT